MLPALRLTAPPSLPLLPEQVSKYQEQPQLLDPLLEDTVQPLTALLRAAAADPAAADLQRVRGVSRLLWQLSVVRWAPAGILPPCWATAKARQTELLGAGSIKWQNCLYTLACLSYVNLATCFLPTFRGYKTVLRFFPNDVASFEPLVALLVHLDQLDQQQQSELRLEGDGKVFWEAQASGPELLFFLGMLCNVHAGNG